MNGYAIFQGATLALPSIVRVEGLRVVMHHVA